jgi:hypothetical protein
MARIILCDHCGSSEAAASEILVNVVRRVPASGPGKKGTGELVSQSPVELCVPCADRLALSVGKLVEAVREGRFELPPLPEPEGESEGGTVGDLTEGGQEQAPEPTQELQQALPLAEPATTQEPARRGRKTG